MNPVVTPAARGSREATLRALVSGGLIGALLAAGNVYTSLKISLIDGGGITAALLGFGIFALSRRAKRNPYGALENNITQTAAASAAVMSFVTGVVGPIPALAMVGARFSNLSIILFGAAVAILGIFVAALLRRRLISEEALPFPTGAATGEVIETLFGARHLALRRILLLALGVMIAGAITWFRDARPAIIPQGFMFGGTVAGVSAAALGLGMAASPLSLATGAMVGVRNSIGMLLGAAIARIVLAPWLLHSGIVADVETGSLNTWLVWPSLGLMVAGSFLPLFLEGGAIMRSFRGLAAVLRPSTTKVRSTDRDLSPRLWAPLVAVAVAIVLLLGWLTFGSNPLVMLIGVALALVLANVGARATGETDMAPAGALGTVSLVATSSRGTVTDTMAGSVTMGVSTQTSQMLWAFRAGQRLGASPRAQVGAQILGALVGAVVTVPVYHVIVSSYGIGNERMPAVAALSWKATAAAMRGLSALPRFGGAALLLGLGAGAALTLLGRLRFARWLPSAASIGVAFMMPFTLTLAVCAGALLVVAARSVRRGSRIDQNSVLALAAGGIAGESLVGVVIAVLIATGLL
jgi:OPT family oligopeptide transporter